MIEFYDFMIEKVQGGLTMHEALDSYYGNFSNAEVSIIEAGERTGKLNSALVQIAEQTEKVDSITRKIKGAMTYPFALGAEKRDTMTGIDVGECDCTCVTQNSHSAKWPGWPGTTHWAMRPFTVDV